jgi:nitrite reductase/ring-hydroxylating ferredoxin subunit
MWTVVWGVVFLFSSFLVKKLVLRLIQIWKRMKHKESTAKVLKRLKRERIKHFPPPYPNGWFHAARCDEVTAKEVKEVPFMGKIIILFRGIMMICFSYFFSFVLLGEDGAARAADPYCPHLGASFASGGFVEKNCLVCPFHHYKFDVTEKKCVEIPNLPEGKSIPSQLALKTYPVREVDNMILVWWHGEGKFTISFFSFFFLF